MMVRKIKLSCLAFAIMSVATFGEQSGADDVALFTPLEVLRSARVIANAEAYPARNYLPEHLVDGREDTEFASNGKGKDTFVVLDLGSPLRVAGIRHVDRHDVATVARSQLTFSNEPGFDKIIQQETVDHANRSGGVTVSILNSPVVARYVRWQPTELNAAGHQCLGGSELQILIGNDRQPTLERNEIKGRVVQALVRRDNALVRPIEISVNHRYAEPVDLLLKVGDLDPVPLHLEYGVQSVQLTTAEVTFDEKLPLTVEFAGKEIAAESLAISPVRHWQFFFLPHSHVDIGYTHVQTEVEKKQWGYLEEAINISAATADYPPESRFKWNCEVMWAVDSYLKQASKQQKAEFFAAVRKGWLHLDGLYGNELTGLCRPEELMHLTACARRISREYDVPIDAAMISDVPGYTWGTVPVLVQSGIKYLSIGPNHVHRIGRTLDAWGDKPFWWVSPSGQERLLCWMAGKAYSWFHDSRVGILKRDHDPEPFLDYLNELSEKHYAYDMIQVRYSIGGDNGPPDRELSEFVKCWNKKFVWPRMAITTTSKLMHEFEDRYGDQLPEVRGDFTPYWEDGAASSAKETSMTRMAAEQLSQTETLWAVSGHQPFPAGEFELAWRDVLLYNEHTWGAHCSITQPDSDFTKSQWKIKQAYATNATEEARRLRGKLARSISNRDRQSDQVIVVDVFNTQSWTRTDLVRLPDIPLEGRFVRDADGQVMPSEGQAQFNVFLARDVPPLGAKRFFIEKGKSESNGSVRVFRDGLSSDSVEVKFDKEIGVIASLRWKGIDKNLVDLSRLGGIGQYCYVSGREPTNPHLGRLDEIQTIRNGGLVGTLSAKSTGLGCNEIRTTATLIDGIERVDVTVTLDKKRVLDQEAVHIGFPFNIPQGVIRVDIPWAVIQPNQDQLPGACKNYLTAGRWIDVSNDRFGITLATLDAPMIEVGNISMDIDKPFGAECWIDELEPSQTLYSYVMNNYWETNYKASQEGKVSFRYSLMPHKEFDQVAAMKFGIERSQPLIALKVGGKSPVLKAPFRVEPSNVLVTSMKPSRDGKATVVRLWNAGDAVAKAKLVWSESQPGNAVMSNPLEEVGISVNGSIEMPAMGIVTIRVAR